MLPSRVRVDVCMNVDAKIVYQEYMKCKGYREGNIDAEYGVVGFWVNCGWHVCWNLRMFINYLLRIFWISWFSYNWYHFLSYFFFTFRNPNIFLFFFWTKLFYSCQSFFLWASYFSRISVFIIFVLIKDLLLSSFSVMKSGL